MPVEDLFAAIGGDVQPDPTLPRFLIQRGGVQMEITLDQTSFRVGNQEANFTLPPMELARVPYVDARDVVEALGGQYGWDGARRRV